MQLIMFTKRLKELGNLSLEEAGKYVREMGFSGVELPVRRKGTPYVLPEEVKGVKVLRPKGCSVCNDTGYRGRTGLYEVMQITDEIRNMILSRAQPREMKKKAVEQGMITLRRSGLIKIKEGVTSIEEVLRETVRD